MALQRYSAVEMFGVPLDEVPAPSEPEKLLELMSAYGIEGQDIPRDAVDITPYYWQDPPMRFYVSLAHPEGPAVVEFLPRYEGSEPHFVAKLGCIAVGLPVPGMRRLEIPTDQQAMALVGPGPRFTEQICVHELIAYLD